MTQWSSQHWLELVAASAAVMYLLLAIRENIWCWLFAFISTSLYVYVFYGVSLLSESLLNVFYLIMAIYGWLSWYRADFQHHERRKSIQSWPVSRHIGAIVLTGICVPILGFWMSRLGADYPYGDAFTSCFAVLATFMVVHKVLENWYYWLIINSVSIYLYWQKSMYPTVVLFLIYLVLVFFGIRSWRRSYVQQN